MRPNNTLKVGDVLYSVDPRKLSITVYNFTNPCFDSNITTNYENFHFEERLTELQFPIDNFPIEFRGVLYFQSEDEAHVFIKTQIGM